MKKNNLKKIIICIISFLVFICITFSVFIGYTTKGFFERNPDTPTKNEYPFVIKKYIDRYGNKIGFFPDTIPDNANDYYCLFEDNFDGYNIHHLRFKTDKKYIENTINKNKDKIYQKIEYDKIDDYYKLIDDSFDIEDKSNTVVYILKDKNFDRDYTSGIITSKSNEILFFYINFNLEY